MTRPGLNLSLHKQTELKPKQWVLNQKAIKKRATFACRSLIVKVVPPGIEHIIYSARKCLMHNVLTYFKNH